MNLKLPNHISNLKPLIFLFFILFTITVFGQGTLEVTGNGIIIINGASTPSISNNTNFGSLEMGLSKNNLFVLDNIENGGNPSKRLNGIVISISGDPEGNFTPSTSNLGSLKGSDNPISHGITFRPFSTGLKSALVTIVSSNSTNPSYTFVITGTGLAAQPEINLKGNGITILNGDNTPSLSDGTNFGTTSVGSTINKSFSIENIGNASLNLTGVPLVSVSSNGEFTISSQPSSAVILNGNNLSFSVSYNPVSGGTHTGIISISNNDSNENPYTFSISGNSVIPEPEIDIQGNGISISDGDISPSISDDTDFGQVNIGTSTSKTYTILNTGTSTLNISNISLTNGNQFSITGVTYPTVINAGSSTTFMVTFFAPVAGTQNDMVTIINDDSNESSYNFNIQATAANITYTPTTSSPDWTVTKLTPNYTLDNPNTMIYGPDGFLWITERVGKKVVKVNPNLTGGKTTMLDLTSVVYQTGGQDGLMGMAVHPDLYSNVTTTTNNYVYLAYTYNASGRKLRIARYTYNHNGGNGFLESASEIKILEGFDASNDHNSGKLQIGPDMKLYYTAGDQGYNQFANACMEIRAQYLPTSGGQTTSSGDKSEYKGKILRMNLDGSIPLDNPTLGGFQTHIYTYGHRNPQGLVFGSDGTLYSSEHGAKVDDELNIIMAGKNYGWPNIAGYYDNSAYGYCNWSSSTNCNSGSFSDHNCPTDVTPIQEFNPINDAILSNFQKPIGTYNSTVSFDPSGGFLTWPTVAPSSLAIYEGTEIPDWNKSLLIPTLKRGTIFRAKLNASGNALESQVYEEFHSSNDRYRDVIVAPDGYTIYAITDSSGSTSGPSGTAPQSLVNPGVVMKFKYINCADDDGDGICNADDICEGSNDTADADGDGIPDGCDSCNDLIDTDADGVSDCIDQEINSPCPLDVDLNGVSNDNDGDGVTNCLDLCEGYNDAIDSDGDSVPDGCDACEGFNDHLDTDADGIPDGCDSCNDLVDADNDGVSDCIDLEINSPCPLNVDTNGISIDSDGDSIADCVDNCINIPNTDQADADGNRLGDACDDACTPATISFNINTLTNSGGSGTTQPLILPNNSEDISFSINGLDAVQGGKPSNRYVERVEISYTLNGNTSSILHDGTGPSSVQINLPNGSQSIKVTLTNGLGGSTNATMSVFLSIVEFCSTGSSAKYVVTKKSTMVDIKSYIKVYPNPASSKLFIDYIGFNENAIANLYTTTGQLVKSLEIKYSKQNLDIHGLSQGLYLLRITDNFGKQLKSENIIIK